MRRPIELLALVSGASLLALASVAAWRIVTPPPGGAHISSRSAPPPLARTSELQQAVTDDTPLPLLSEDAVRLAPTSPSPHPSEAVAEQRFDGPMEQVLYAGDRPALAPNLVAQALRLFSHKLDLTRDLALGDRVRLLVRGGGTPRLDFAELDGARGAVRLYRIADQGEDADAFADATGAPLRRLLLRTPLAHPRLTSGFGLRFHPAARLHPRARRRRLRGAGGHAGPRSWRRRSGGDTLGWRLWPHRAATPFGRVRDPLRPPVRLGSAADPRDVRSPGPGHRMDGRLRTLDGAAPALRSQIGGASHRPRHGRSANAGLVGGGTFRLRDPAA